VNSAVAAALDRTTDGYSCEHRIIQKNGTIRYVIERGRVEFNESGATIRMIGTVQDVTPQHEIASLSRDLERKETELSRSYEEMNRVSENLQLIVDSARLGTWNWDFAGEHLVLNEYAFIMLGYTLSDVYKLVGKKLEKSEERNFRCRTSSELGGVEMHNWWLSLVHEADRGGYHEVMAAHLREDDGFFQQSTRMMHKDGKWRWVLARGRRSDKVSARIVGTYTDISAQKWAEIGAREANEAKSWFLSCMSHELRTPLHGIVGLVDVLASSEMSDEHSTIVTTLQESIKYLQYVISDVLDISSINEGKMQLQMDVVDLRSELRDIEQLFSRSAASKDITVTFDLPETIPDHIITDKIRLSQIANNLLSNALKFTAPGGRVSLSTTHSNNELTITVRDTGCGIASDQLEKIFEAFVQSETGHSRDHSGSGLGLAISRRMAILLGGTLTCSSEVDVGSSFILTLPVETFLKETPATVAIHSREAQTTEQDPTARGNFKKLQCLVAEDNKVNQYLLNKMLNRLGIDHDIVNNGKEALDAVASRRSYDIVLMDTHMPEMDGIISAERIQMLPNLIKKPLIIATSADTSEETLQRLAKVGVTSLLSKPFRMNDLATAIAQVELRQ
jgi:signal transduction histidine kinase/ActR/RegA family two-component response regulator